MSNHLLALAIKPVDFARSIGGGVALRNSLQAQGQQSELRGLKIEGLKQGVADNALMRAARVDAFDIFQGGTPEQQRAAIMRLGELDPKEAASIQQLVANADDRQRAALAEMSEDLARAAMFADTPEKWDAAVDHLSEKYPDVAKLKGEFSPEARLKAIRSAMSLHDAIAEALPTPSKDFRRSGADPTRQEFIPGGKADPATIRAQAAARAQPSIQRVLAPLAAKMARGETLTPAEERTINRFKPTDLLQLILGDALGGRGQDGEPATPSGPEGPGLIDRITGFLGFGDNDAEAAQPEPFNDRLNRVQGDLRDRGGPRQGVGAQGNPAPSQLGINPNTGRRVTFQEFQAAVRSRNPGVADAEIVALWTSKYAPQ